MWGISAAVRAFGYTGEDLRVLLAPMAIRGEEPIGSMGTDTPLAVLSTQAPVLSSYFHQLFAQVTNPPIDSIREEVIMSLECYIGPEQNLLETTPEHAHRLRVRGGGELSAAAGRVVGGHRQGSG